MILAILLTVLVAVSVVTARRREPVHLDPKEYHVIIAILIVLALVAALT